MNDPKHKYKNNAELDCEVTVQEGSHMTCDMIEKDSDKEEKTKEESQI